MLRISAAIAVLTLIGTTANVSAAQPQKPSNTKECTEEEFMANCHKKSNVKYCDWWWDKQRRMGGNCMR